MSEPVRHTAECWDYNAACIGMYPFKCRCKAGQRLTSTEMDAKRDNAHKNSHTSGDAQAEIARLTEALRQAVEDRDFWERKAGDEHVLVEAVGRKVCEVALRQQQRHGE